MRARETIVEASIERAVREQLRAADGYSGGDREQRELLEREVREAIRVRRSEDEV